MLYLMRTEWKKVRLPATAALILVTAAACILSCTLYQNYTIFYDLDAWEVGTELYSFIFPLLVVLPLCWNLYYERKDHFLLYVLPRVPQGKYLAAKWTVHALCAFLILFIPYVLSAVCVLYVKKPVSLYDPAALGTPFEHVFLNAYTQAPMLYAALLSSWKGLIGVLVMSFGFVLSMYVKNIFVILTVPFIYTVLENFILSVLRLEKYRLVVSFEPTSISNTAVNTMSYFAGPVILIIVILMTSFFFSKIRKAAVVEI